MTSELYVDPMNKSVRSKILLIYIRTVHTNYAHLSSGVIK